MPRLGSDAGYTLAEMVAALLIVSLAIGGAMQASFLLERQQRATIAAARDLDQARDTSRRFAALLAAYSPAAAGQAGLEGDAQGFRFACKGASCGAQLATGERGDELRLKEPRLDILSLADLRRPGFVYVSEGVESDSWPVASAHPTPLEAILLLSQSGQGERPVLTARIWREEPAGCRFDVIARACRATSH